MLVGDRERASAWTASHDTKRTLRLDAQGIPDERGSFTIELEAIAYTNGPCLEKSHNHRKSVVVRVIAMFICPQAAARLMSTPLPVQTWFSILFAALSASLELCLVRLRPASVGRRTRCQSYRHDRHPCRSHPSTLLPFRPLPIQKRRRAARRTLGPHLPCKIEVVQARQVEPFCAKDLPIPINSLLARWSSPE